MRWEHFAKNIGSAIIIPDNPVVVNTPGMWKIIYKVGPREITVGGCIRITIPYGFTPPQIGYPASIGFTTMETSNPTAQIDISLGKDPVKGKTANGVWGNNMFLTVSGSPLHEGDTVTVTYGSVEHSVADVGAFSQYFEQETEFTVAADPDGRRSAPRTGFLLVEKQPKMRVISDVGSQLVIVVPSNTVVGEAFGVKTTVRDRYGNVAYGYHGTVSIRLNGAEFTHHLGPEEMGSHIFPNCVLNAPGVYRINAKGSGGIVGESNPTICTDAKPSESIYWGDIHNMSISSAGLGTPDSLYEYGKRHSHLDFCAVTDGDHNDGYLTNEEWEKLKDVVKKHYEPSSFVTFLAYECYERRFGGDKNVYYLCDDEPLERWSDLPDPGKPPQLWDALKGRRAITVPHHTIFDTATHPWDYNDPEFQRLVEIYSVWGCSEKTMPEKQFWPVYSENSVQSGLNKGYRMGIIASSDSHGGHPGNDTWIRHRRGFRGGLVAVYAKELTREAIFEALWNRRCYGTTGERIILDLSLNGSPMGTTLCGKEASKVRKIRARALGTAPIERIDVVRNGCDAYEHAGKGTEEEFVWMDAEDFDKVCLVSGEGESFIYYYVRVTQQNGEMAWGSPVWVSH